MLPDPEPATATAANIASRPTTRVPGDEEDDEDDEDEARGEADVSGEVTRSSGKDAGPEDGPASTPRAGPGGSGARCARGRTGGTPLRRCEGAHVRVAPGVG